MTEPTHYPISAARPELLAPARPGEHVWVLMAAYRLTPDVVDACRGHVAGTGPAPVPVEPETLANADVGCWTCGTRMEHAHLIDTPCPGPSPAITAILDQLSAQDRDRREQR